MLSSQLHFVKQLVEPRRLGGCELTVQDLVPNQLLVTGNEPSAFAKSLEQSVEVGGG